MATRLHRIVLDAADPPGIAAWWSQRLGWPPATATPERGPGTLGLIPDQGQPGVAILVAPRADAAPGSHRIHLDLAALTTRAQAELAGQAVASGARRIDIGQGDVPWVVLADPEGNRFCILEPRAEYATAGALAAVVQQSLDPVAAAAFWAQAAGWTITAAERRFSSLRAPDGTGPAIEFVAVSRLPAGAGRIHLDLAPAPGADPAAEVERLVRLGARPLQVLGSWPDPGHDGRAVLADPEGAAFCVGAGGPPAEPAAPGTGSA